MLLAGLAKDCESDSPSFVGDVLLSQADEKAPKIVAEFTLQLQAKSLSSSK